MSRRKAVFVHGCFWHRHNGCPKTTLPGTRTAFWQEKFANNVARDQRNIRHLTDLGWDAIVIWECETADLEALRPRLVMFLDGG